MTWLRRKRRPDPESERAIKEAERNIADAESGLKDTLGQWHPVLEVGEKAREQLRRNHFAESIDAIFRGRK